ncbi:unnamed protein product [Chironomus riparius]|uniref:Lipase domain-containing protein n=1 Tax=Chironomus riparius TaxID=315576 RepID=A0A9N9S774_9DIPT|nr:unnamed protein product [Chironomus riparius]
MKHIFVIFVLFCGAYSTPIQRTVFTDFIESERWTVTKDGEGHMRLIDLNPIVAEPEPAFDPINDMFFLLFTRSNPTVGQRITFDTASITNSNFRRGAGTRFLIHGWTASSESGENIFTRNEFLALADYNVIVVDWSVGAGAINYITSRNRVGPAGEVVGQFIDFLDEHGFVSHAQVHVIGISLGAHVSGHSGKNTRRGRIAVIFGNDPAGPLFNVNNPDRLDSEDAVYTEAMHTNVGVLGFDLPITHATFYPNWGGTQPGCGADVGGGCSHGRSTNLYSESINSDRFRARQCNGYDDIVARNCPGTGVFAVMGGDSAKDIRGVFFLETNAQSPFAMG